MKSVIHKNAIKVAKKRGGVCLSPVESITTYSSRVQWRCEKGHEWIARVGNVVHNGRWCAECARIDRFDTLEHMQEIANSRGGKCLSKEFKGHHHKLLWECKDGHQWQAEPTTVVHRNSWCPYCVGKNQTIVDLQELAKEKNGKCLSKNYLGAHRKHKWKCDKGHAWEAVPSSVRAGTWCPKCGIEARALKARLITLEKVRKIAIERGGECLSTIEDYSSNHSPVQMKCQNGHVWVSLPGNLLSKKTWCPKCYVPKLKRSIEEMQKIAKEHGGECLSKEYVASDKPLLWKCSEGHVFNQSAKNIINKKIWCKVCKHQEISLSDAHNLAKEMGGTCHSEKAKNTYSLIRWECSKGHRWVANFLNAKEKWCLECRELSSRLIAA